MPVGLKTPRRLLECAQGVEDGRNMSGIPTVNGAIFFDQDYAGSLWCSLELLGDAETVV